MPTNASVRSELRWSSRARVRAAIDGRFLQVGFLSHEPGRGGGKRGVVCGFSPGSRRRMQRRLAQVSVKADLPAFITLTIPDSAIDGGYSGSSFEYRLLCERVHGWLDTWLKRLKRELPKAAGIWKMEGKRRLSGVFEGKLVPHLHLMLWGVPTVSYWNGAREAADYVFEWRSRGAGQARWEFGLRRAGCDMGPCPVSWDMCSLSEWVSVSWYHVVGSGDIKHLEAGTRVERVRSQRGVSSYCSKYLAKVDGVDDVPLYGRCWGIHNRVAMPWAQLVEIEIDGDAGYRLRRVMRRYVEHCRGRSYTVRNGCGMTVFCDAERWWVALVRESRPDPF